MNRALAGEVLNFFQIFKALKVLEKRQILESP